MNDDPKKTTSIPMSDIKRAYGEAVEAADAVAEPTVIGEDGKVVDKKMFDINNLKGQTIRFLPPIAGRETLRHRLGVMDKVMERTKEVAEANQMLVEVGFLEEQCDAIRKAICKKQEKKIEAYKRQFTALSIHSGKDAWPFRIEEAWLTICNLFTKPNPLEPQEYFVFHEGDSIYMKKATEARKEAMQKACADMADLLDIPEAKTVTCVKPSPESQQFRVMHGVSEGIHPVMKKEYMRTVKLMQEPLPASLEYMEKLRGGEIRERNLYAVGDYVEILNGEHKGEHGQIAAIDDGKTWPAFGPKRFAINLCNYMMKSVTCHECQVTKLPVATEFQRYDRVILRHGSSKGQEGTVVSVGKKKDDWVFVMLDNQAAHEEPCGFDAFKLAITNRPNMPKLNDEVTYFADGMEYKDRKGKITKEFLGGDILVEFTDGPGHARVVMGDITRLMTWKGKDDGVIERKSHTGFPVFDEFLKNKPEAAGSMYDILAEPVVKWHDVKFGELTNLPPGVQPIVMPEHYPANSPTKVVPAEALKTKIPLEKGLNIIDGKHVEPTQADIAQMVGRADRSKSPTVIIDYCEGYKGKDVEVLGEVTIDTRGIAAIEQIADATDECKCPNLFLQGHLPGCKHKK
jgi:ribosomal protein L24